MSATDTSPSRDRWRSTRLKFFSSRIYGLSQPPKYEPEGTPFVRATNVARGKLVKEGLVFVSGEVQSEPQIVKLMVGDIIVVRSGAYTGDSAIVTADWAGGIAGYDIVVRLTRYADPQFVAYSLLSPTVLARQIEPMSSRAAQPHLNAEELGDVELMLPTLHEQRAIVDYLDRETVRLDALVAAKERVLGLLAEKRRALITRAVTRGLDPRVHLRHSGISWLGEIPAHWKLQRLKRISPFITVGVVVNPSSYVTPDGVPFLYGSDVTEEGISLEYVRRIPPEVSRGELAKTCLRAGDIVTVRVGAPGVTAVVPPDLEGANCASIMLVRGAASFDPQWLAYAMNCSIGRHQVALVQYGAAQEQFNISHAVDFLFAVPSLSEQRQIVSHLRHETAAVDALCSATRRTIALLKERRAALIAAAVTGKIDVEGTAWTA